MKPKLQELPEDVRNEARQRRGNNDPQTWANADFVAGVVSEFTRSRGDRSRCILLLASDMGLTKSDISDLCLLGETYRPAQPIINTRGQVTGYKPGIREQYADTLTIGHYREAMRSETATKPEQWLALAVDSADEYHGMPMPVTVLRNKVRAANADGKPAKTETYQQRIDRAFKALGDALEIAPDDHKQSIASMRKWLAKVA